MKQEQLFYSFFQGGFECSTHRKADGQRLDLIRSTLHDKYSFEDYFSLSCHGIRTVRDGLRWHLIETYPGYYDWSSFMPMLHAAIKNKTQVIWDLCHYGWPDDINIWKPEFINRFANFAKAVAKVIKNETDEIPFYSPINEISFWAWAGGDVAFFNPTDRGRGLELKHQLVRASIAAIDAIRLIDPRARFIQAEPLINVIDDNNINEAKAYTESQYQAWDMLAGEIWPGLGGRRDLLDIIGVNYYPYNQWYLDGTRIFRGHPNYRPFSDMLKEVAIRYNRPIFIAETGAESNNRQPWINYICNEVYDTICQGLPINGICLYPIVDYPGWDDNRHCETGLLGLVDPLTGYRTIFEPLAQEIKFQHSRFTNIDNMATIPTIPSSINKSNLITYNNL